MTWSHTLEYDKVVFRFVGVSQYFIDREGDSVYTIGSYFRNAEQTMKTYLQHGPKECMALTFSGIDNH